MARAFSAPVIAALTAARCYPVLLAEVGWASGTTRFWSGANNRDFMGETFTAAGDLLSITAVQETVDLRANGLTIALNGVNPAVLALALDERRQGKPVNIWLAFLDADDVELDDPYLLFAGRVDQPKIFPDPDSPTVSVSAESRLIDFQRPRRSRYTAEDQQERYPGDKGLNFLKRLQGLELQWGNQKINPYRPSVVPPPPPAPNGNESGSG